MSLAMLASKIPWSWGKTLRLTFFYFDEFRGPLKGALGALRGPKGPLRAKSRSFGDRNIIFGK